MHDLLKTRTLLDRENHAMRIAVLSYPMLTQQYGGLEIQIRETLAALQSATCDARLIDPITEKLSDFDLIHVFAAGSGNFRIVQFANMVKRPVVMSPLLRDHWTESLGHHARLLDRWMGRLTRWEVSTEYRDLLKGLEGSARLVALGQRERQSIIDAFRIPPSRVEVVPNGIPARFFEAGPEAFVAHYGIQPGFVLCVASIDSHKNQLGLARALAGIGRAVVLIGDCNESNRSYLEEVLKLPNTHYLGRVAYDDPLLPSAYAAAGVFALVSMSEVMPLTTLEALAAGTPVVMTRHHGMDTAPFRHVIQEVEPRSASAIVHAIEYQLKHGAAPAACSQSVQHLTWAAVAKSLFAIYNDVLQRHRANP